MTLIAAFTHKNYGTAFVGDMLLSTEKSEQTADLLLPARIDSKRPVEARHICGMAQKVIIISNTFVVAWAGSYLTAKSILNAMQAYLPHPNSTNEVFHFIDSYGLSEKELENIGLAFSILTIGKDGDFAFQTAIHNGNLLEASEKLNIRFAGSGRYHFFDSIAVDIEKASIGSDAIEIFWSEIIGRAATSFFSEINNWANYDFSYGGGFEFVVPTKMGWVKLPYTSSFWLPTVTGYEPVNAVTNYQYNNDGSVCVSQIIPTKDGITPRLFNIEPILSDADASLPTIPKQLSFSISYILQRANYKVPAQIEFRVIWGS